MIQQVKHLVLRLGTRPNPEQYIFDGAQADAHIQGYLNRGWRIHTVNQNPAQIDLDGAFPIFYLLIRDDDEKVQLSLPIEDGKSDSPWVNPTDKTLEPVAA